MEEEKAAIRIQRFIRNYWFLHIFEKGIQNIIKKYKSNLNRSETKTKSITSYELAFGFTEESRNGSKIFSQVLGDIIPQIYNLSFHYNNVKTTSSQSENYIGGCDGFNSNTLFECKNKHNTTKASQAFNETKEKLEYAIQNNKNFILLCLVDRGEGDNDKPLHQFTALKNISTVQDYDKNKHKYLSGLKIFNYFFPYAGDRIQNCIFNSLQENSLVKKNQVIADKILKKELIESMISDVKEINKDRFNKKDVIQYLTNKMKNL